MRFRSQLDSTRFFYVQEGLGVGLIGAFAKVFFPEFPVLELYGFVGPLIAIAFGIKSWGNIKENEARSGNRNGQDLPIR